MIVSARLIVYRSQFGSKGVASVTTPPRTLLVMDPATFALQFSPSERARLASVADLIATEASADFDVAQLAEAEVLITSWGFPPITDTVLDAAPRLRAIIHAAVSVRSLFPTDFDVCGFVVQYAAVMTGRHR